MNDLVCFPLTTGLVPGAPRPGVGQKFSMIRGGGEACVSYVSRERDRNRKVEEGTSRGYKHELFLLGVSSGGREVTDYL